MKIFASLFVSISSLMLLGCGASGEDELRIWMADQRASTKPSVQPLTEPKSLSLSLTIKRVRWSLLIKSS